MACLWLRFRWELEPAAPAELFAERAVVAVSRGDDQLEPDVGPLNADAVVGLERAADATVDDDRRAYLNYKLGTVTYFWGNWGN